MLSNNDGCVVSRSNEAKALGIKMGEPFFKIKGLQRTHQLQACSSNYTLYGDLSKRVMETLSQFTPEIETYSIDEAFLNLTGIPDDMLTYGLAIRERVKQWTGIPVGVGIAPTKTLAKLANHIAKKSQKANGVVHLEQQKHIDYALSITEVSDVWGIGRKHSIFLQRNGIHTAKELRDASDSWIRQHLTITGLRTVHELRGIPCISLELSPAPNKNICISRSFGTTIREIEELKEALLTYTSRAAEKLRKSKQQTGHMTVFLHTSPFREPEKYYYNQTSLTLPYPTDYTPDMVRYAVQGLERLYQEGYDYIKCGIIISDLSPKTLAKQDLLDSRNRPKEQKLMEALDKINTKMGHNKILFLGAGLKKEWQASSDYLSQRYSTNWAELLEIKI